MKVLITGSEGFIGKNLKYQIPPEWRVFSYHRGTKRSLFELIEESDAIIHLAGTNRGNDEDFIKNNIELSRTICNILASIITSKKRVIFSSSIHYTRGDCYGNTKSHAEDLFTKLANDSNHEVVITRLPNVFGKWCKPNYNSVVATFCNAVANDLDFRIDNPEQIIELVHIDQVVEHLINIVTLEQKSLSYNHLEPRYKISISDLAKTLLSFKTSDLFIDNLGSNFIKLLYATYLSYLPKDKWQKEIIDHEDNRGTFAELFKTKDCGQISFFTSKPGIVRGNHFHHTKNERFVVIHGDAEFRFENILTGEKHHILASSSNLREISTVPGWAHSIKNIGTDTMIVALWANENFDPLKPDTCSYEINE